VCRIVRDTKPIAERAVWIAALAAAGYGVGWLIAHPFVNDANAPLYTGRFIGAAIGAVAGAAVKRPASAAVYVSSTC